MHGMAVSMPGAARRVTAAPRILASTSIEIGCVVSVLTTCDLQFGVSVAPDIVARPKRRRIGSSCSVFGKARINTAKTDENRPTGSKEYTQAPCENQVSLPARLFQTP